MTVKEEIKEKFENFNSTDFNWNKEYNEAKSLMNSQKFGENLTLFNSSTGKNISRSEIVLASIKTYQVLFKKRLDNSYIFTYEKFYLYSVDEKKIIEVAYKDILSSVYYINRSVLLIKQKNGTEHETKVACGSFCSGMLMALKKIVESHKNENKEEFAPSTRAIYEEAMAGDPESMCLYGAMLENGEGCAVDIEEGLKWIKKSAEAEWPEAMSYYASKLIDGENVPKNENLGFYYAHKAAEEADEFGCYLMGLCYETGIGCEKNSEKALEYYKEGADLGEKDCMCMAGKYLMKGIGCDVDVEQAITYLKDAADEGVLEAILCLTDIYTLEKYGTPNRKMAYKYGKMAVEQGRDDVMAYLEKHEENFKRVEEQKRQEKQKLEKESQEHDLESIIQKEKEVEKHIRDFKHYQGESEEQIAIISLEENEFVEMDGDIYKVVAAWLVRLGANVKLENIFTGEILSFYSDYRMVKRLKIECKKVGFNVHKSLFFDLQTNDKLEASDDAIFQAKLKEDFINNLDCNVLILDGKIIKVESLCEDTPRHIKYHYIPAMELKCGDYIAEDDDSIIWKIVSAECVKPGKGSPYVRVILQTLSDTTFEKSFYFNEKIKTIYVEERSLEVLSNVDFLFFCRDLDSGEEVEIMCDNHINLEIDEKIHALLFNKRIIKLFENNK